MFRRALSPMVSGGGWGTRGSEYAKLAHVAILLSLLGNAVLFGLKLWVGIVSDSIGLQADAWHTISDSISSLIVLVGVRLAIRPADAQHPFGHGRYELVAAMGVGVLLGLIACYFILGAIEGLAMAHRANFGSSAIVVTVISMVVKEGMALYTFRAARLTGNRALRADAWHHRSDALSSLVVLLGVVVGHWVGWIDSVLALLVAALIGHVAYRTLRSTASMIVGESPPEELKRSIVEHVGSLFPNCDLRLHDFRWHNYVHRQELTFHIVLPGSMSVEAATSITAHIERSVLEAYQIEVTVHIES